MSKLTARGVLHDSGAVSGKEPAAAGVDDVRILQRLHGTPKGPSAMNASVRRKGVPRWSITILRDGPWIRSRPLVCPEMSIAC